jgi:adenylate cyclase
MTLKTIYKKINYFLLLSVSEFIRLVVRFIQKDAEVFLETYPTLVMEPLEAWQHLWLCIRQIIEYLKGKIPDFIPVAIKLATAFSLIIIIGLVSLGGLIGINQTKLLEKQADHFGEALATQAAYSIKEPLLADDDLLIKIIIRKLISAESIVGVSVFKDDYALVASYGFKSKKQHFDAEGKERFQKVDVIRMEDTDKGVITYAVPIIHSQLFVGYISLSFDGSILTKAKTETRNTGILITALTLLIGIFTSFYMAKQLTKPIDKLIDATRAMQAGNYNYNFGDDRRKDELGVLMTTLNEMGNGLLQKEKVENVFSRYVSPQVANQVLNDLRSLEGVELGGKRVEASIFFADIVGFTSLSEKMEPQKISELLNVYFSKIAEAVHFCGGHVDKYIGDCAMVVFGVPLKNDDHAFKSIACAWMILRLIEALNKKRKATGELTVEFRIGVNAGVMLAGNMGSAERMEYTVVGDSVNLASRLLGVTEPGELVITELMMVNYKLKNKILFEVKEIIQLRGKKLPVRTLKITDITTPFRNKISNEIIKIISASNA